MMKKSTSKKETPKIQGYFGDYGGRFVPETLMGPLEELTRAYLEAKEDPGFQKELDELLDRFAGRPTPLFHARRLSQKVGHTIYLKREDLCHTGAHKINNALGQALLARRMGKKRIIAETGAGQHGVATATVCALLEMECEVYMGVEDMERQALNVFRMELLGAGVTPVDAGSRTLKDAINEAMRDWVTNVESTHYLLAARNSVQTGPNRWSSVSVVARRNVKPPTRSSLTRPASRSKPRCLETPDWAMPSTAVNSLTLSRSLTSNRSNRRRASSPKRRKSVLASFIYINLHICINCVKARAKIPRESWNRSESRGASIATGCQSCAVKRKVAKLVSCLPAHRWRSCY